MPTHPFLHALPPSHRYRALLLGLGGKIICVRAIAAGDDAEASGIVRDMLDGRAVELWDGGRFIEQFGPIQT